jgi:hypothetical protein
MAELFSESIGWILLMGPLLFFACAKLLDDADLDGTI